MIFSMKGGTMTSCDEDDNRRDEEGDCHNTAMTRTAKKVGDEDGGRQNRKLTAIKQQHGGGLALRGTLF